MGNACVEYAQTPVFIPGAHRQIFEIIRHIKNYSSNVKSSIVFYGDKDRFDKILLLYEKGKKR